MPTKLVLVFFVALVKGDDFSDFSTIEGAYADIAQEYHKYSNLKNDFPPSFTSYPNNGGENNVEYRSVNYDVNALKKGKTYDFIVVGGGSAGAVIASRLSEVPQWQVLLLEAGDKESFFCKLPMFAPTLQMTNYNWGYLMEYQKGFALGMQEYRLGYPRGRALGGTSTINYMMYTRGHPLDYDRWAKNGNPGWSYKEVLPYFKKSENSSIRVANPYYHNRHGVLSVEDVYRSPLVGAFIEGGYELGIKYVDYTSNDMMGFSTIQSNTLKGLRHSTSSAFLEPIKHRPNLHILTSAFVTKILIDNTTTPRAYGVEYYKNTQKTVVYATKEVVLSAGSFSSAQLLMLAGIGPKEHLHELGIPLLKDLPVGKRMLDHISFVGLSFSINQSYSLSVDKMLSPVNIYNYVTNGKGPWSSLGGVEGIGYIKTNISEETLGYPDLELIFVGGSVCSDFGVSVRRSMRIRDDVYNAIFKPLHGRPTWTIFPMLVHPKSVGFMKLRSRNPFDYPLFYGNYLSDPQGHDLKTLIAGVRFVLKLSETEPFRKIGTKLNSNLVPGCEVYVFNTDRYWECAIRTLSVTMSHQVATNKMGPAGDPESVVDHRLKVHGIDRLRVADCSVIPVSTTAHTNAPAIMVGEKAADLIKDSWQSFLYEHQ